MKKIVTTISLAAANIAIAFAQTTINIGQTATQGQVNGGALLSLLGLAQTIVARLVPFAIGVAVIVFFWFLIQFIVKGSSDGAKRDEYIKGMTFSILALFVMVSIWGIVGFLGSVFGIGQGGNVPVPGVPVPGN